MRNFKKFLTLVLAVMMVVSAFSFSTSAASQFTDVKADNEYLAKSVSLLNYMGIAKGVSDTEFGVAQPVTRQQFALFIYRLMKGGKDAPAASSNTTRFTDLTDPTYFYAISWANAQGIVNGRSATTFDPTGEITLQEAYTMIIRALGYEENETLAYPFGYIEKAEKENVALDEGLDSKITYTDKLTRGDMAIILYNTFFAEVGVPDVANKEKQFSDGTWYIVQEETYKTLCEKVFDVKEVEYQAVATPHYAVDGQEVTDDLGYNAVLFERRDDDVDVKAPALAYIKAEDLSIDAKALDDYFLAHFTMYVTLDEDDDNAISSVLFADSNMVKKTVNDLKFATVTTNKADSYYGDTDAKLLSGKATTGTDTIYFFNAPYSYSNPTYATSMDDDQKYLLRNEEDIQAIDFDLSDDEKGYYKATINDVITNDVYDATGFFADQANQLVKTYRQIYYGGLYEADIYDVDGDGIFDYIDYKPYTFFQVNTDDDYYFYDDGVEDESATIPVVYTNDAKLLGEKFADEDYVLGYFHQDANEIKVAAVIKPVTTKVKSVKTSTKTITFTDGKTAKVDGAWKLVTNYTPENVVFDFDDYSDKFVADNNNFGSLLEAAVIDDADIDFYVYNDVVLFQEGADTKGLKFTNNLIVPVSGSELKEQFDSKVGDMVTYINAYVDGKEKWVPVVTKDIYPDIVSEFDTAYAGQLCTYSIDADGLYTLDSLAFKTNEDGEYKGINKDLTKLDDDKDDSIQYIETGLNDITLTKISGTRFTLNNAGGTRAFDRVLNLKSYTKIIVKNHNTATDETEYKEYTATDFTNTAEVALNNVSFVLSNDVDSTSRENLVLLYGEAEDFEIKGSSTTKGLRIVRASTPGVDDDGYYRNFYEVYDPFTGKTEDIAGSANASSAGSLKDALTPGTVTKLQDGKVNDKTGAKTYGNLQSTSGLVWITDYTEGDKTLSVAPVDAVECWQDAENYVADGSATNVDGEAFPTKGSDILFEVDNNTVVTVLKHGEKTGSVNNFRYGNFSLGDASILSSNKNEYKCYNTKVEGSKGTYKTGYAKYLKAYITYTEAKNDDDLPTVDYVVILVNGDEAKSVLTTHTNTEHEAE